MDVELQVNNSAAPEARYVSWAPASCRVRVTNPTGATSPVNLTITGVSAASGGAVVFRRSTTGSFSNSLTLSVPITGASVPFFVAGRFGRPSVKDRDVKIEARAGATRVGSAEVMVRIRKNANTLTTDERDRFVSALAKLNNQGLGRFKDFRDMHVSVTLAQAHGAPGFLPWHRAYLLDLERELQVIDASVALPYWRFDRPAPNIFTRDFLGASDAIGTVQFNATNPLFFWSTDSSQGMNRTPDFPTSAGSAQPFHRGANTGHQQPVPAVPTHGRQSAWISAHEFRRLHPGPSDCSARSIVLSASLQRRSVVGEMATTEQPLRPWPGRLLRQQSPKPARPQSPRHDVAVERNNRRHAPADGARGGHGRVPLRERARPESARAGLPGLPRADQCRIPHGVRLR